MGLPCQNDADCGPNQVCIRGSCHDAGSGDPVTSLKSLVINEEDGEFAGFSLVNVENPINWKLLATGVFGTAISAALLSISAWLQTGWLALTNPITGASNFAASTWSTISTGFEDIGSGAARQTLDSISDLFPDFAALFVGFVLVFATLWAIDYILEEGL